MIGLYEIHQGLVDVFPDLEEAESYLEDMLDTKGPHLTENYYLKEIADDTEHTEYTEYSAPI